jgi:probable phosphoglycerate mutase
VALLLLIRHGHTDVTGVRIPGWAPGIHLSARGRAQAEALAARLRGFPLAAVYASPLERCVETAEPLARAHGLPVRVRDHLGEVRYGSWTGRSIRQLSRTRMWRIVQHTPSQVRFPGGETLLEVQERAVGEAERIAAAHPRRPVALVTHGDVVRLVLAHYAGLHPDLIQRIVVDPVSVSAVALGDRIPRILRVNDTGDLADLRPGRRRGNVRG